MKRCPECGKYKEPSEFPRNKRTKDGLATYCKPCHNARGRAAKERLYGGSRHYHLLQRYGIGADDVAALIESQGGVCAICGRPDPQHVDHCHETGLIRGILCFNCNGGLGQFRDDPSLLAAAIDYLHRERQQVVRPVVRRGRG
jgi:hypothetical protein